MLAATRAPWTPTFARRTHGASDELAGILALSNATGLISFAGGLPDSRTFATDVLAELAGGLFHSDAAVALQYSPTPGLPGLRDALAERIGARDGRRPAEAELMVTSGTIDALGLVAKALIDKGDLIVTESPTYLGAIDAFRAYEADVRGIAIDAEGIDVAAFERLCTAGPPPRLLYVIPDHQNPTGLTMSATRRVALVEVCRRHGVLLFEDVAYRELGFNSDEQPPPTLWSLAPDIVVQAGTTSKTFFPGVRLGWAVGPPAVIAQMVVAKQNSDQCAGALGQRLLEEYLRGGHMDPQLALARDLYRQRCTRMLAALDVHMPAGVTWTRPGGGFFTWLSAPAGFDATALSARARDSGVAFVPGRPFHPAGDGANHLRLSFSRVEDADIDEGVARLGRLITAALENR